MNPRSTGVDSKAKTWRTTANSEKEPASNGGQLRAIPKGQTNCQQNLKRQEDRLEYEGPREAVHADSFVEGVRLWLQKSQGQRALVAIKWVQKAKPEHQFARQKKPQRYAIKCQRIMIAPRNSLPAGPTLSFIAG
eukprot:scaffold15599_cov54-Attheya_sp.AAC.2